MDDARMKKSAAVRQGLVILGILAALTLIEYFVGVFLPWGWLLLLALIKAVVVVQYFMHVSRVFSSEGGH
jgi:heme/copper-type cytochrome/quinol oxidase subunit 4